MTRIYDRARIAVLLCCLLNAVLGLLGIMLVIRPDLSIRLVSVVLGAVAILFGITRILGFFSDDLYRLAFEHDNILGALQVVIGISLLLYGRWLWETFSLLMGFVMLTDSMFKFRMALEAKKFGLDQWTMILIASVITGILGLIGIFLPDRTSCAIIIVFGINILSYAAMNLITVLTAVKTAKGKRPIIIEET